MDFIDDIVGKVESIPPRVAPLSRQTNHFRRAMHAFRLVARSWVSPFAFTGKPVEVTRSGSDSVRKHLVVSPFTLIHRDSSLRRANHMKLHLSGVRRPHEKMTMTFSDAVCAQRKAHPRCPLLLKNSIERAGSTTDTDHGRPWCKTGLASTPPRLPQLPPQYWFASLFAISSQRPPQGTPIR